MIDVSNYIAKLERLKEYISMFVELKHLETMERETFWRIYKEAGIMFATIAYKTPIPTFEYWLNFDTNPTPQL